MLAVLAECPGLVASTSLMPLLKQMQFEPLDLEQDNLQNW